LPVATAVVAADRQPTVGRSVPSPAPLVAGRIRKSRDTRLLPGVPLLAPQPGHPPVSASASACVDPGVVVGTQLALSGAGGYTGPVGWTILIWSLFRAYPVVMWSLVGVLVAACVAYQQFRERPVPPPNPMVFTGRPLPVAVGFRRAKLSEQGLVARLTNTGGANLGVVWARPAGGKWADLYSLPPGGTAEVGWLELPAPLRSGDRIEVWVAGFDPQTITMADPDSERIDRERKQIAGIALPSVSAARPPPTLSLPASGRPAFRGSLIGRGEVLVLTNGGAAEAPGVVVRINRRFQATVGAIPAGQTREVGWAELGVELRSADEVEIWVGAQLDQKVVVP
jgi:hypothetical protein